MLRLGFVTLALIATPFRLLCAQGAAEEHRCNYTTRHYCDENGCTSVSPEGAYLLIPDSRTLRLAGIRNSDDEPPVQVRRCDGNGCTPVDVTSSLSGAFRNVWGLDGGYMLKFVAVSIGLIEAEAGQFVEVATSMLGTFISYGSCPWERP